LEPACPDDGGKRCFDNGVPVPTGARSCSPAGAGVAFFCEGAEARSEGREVSGMSNSIENL
jgi:hypothetical protein